MRPRCRPTASTPFKVAALLLAASCRAYAAVQVTFGQSAAPVSPIEAPRHLGDSQYSTRFPDVSWDQDAWTLTTTQLRPHDYHAMQFTANGYFGLTMASTGPFYQAFAETVGWPVFNQRQTFGTISGFYDRQEKTNGSNYDWLYQYGWDSVISGIPHWGPLVLELDDGSYLAANTSTDELTNVRLVQDFKQGLAQWQYVWSPKSKPGLSLNVTYVTFAHKLHVNRGYVHLSISPSQDCNVAVYNILDGRNALRTTFKSSGSEGSLLYSAVNPNGVDNVTAWIYSSVVGSPDLTLSPQNFTQEKPFLDDHPATVAQVFNLTFKSNQTSTLLKHVGVASTDGFQNPQGIAREAVQTSMKTTYEKILDEHAGEWQAVFPRNSVADYNDPSTGRLPARPELIEKAITSVVSIFGMLMNTISKNALAMVGNTPINVNGISVCGLSADCYGGQKFWDQDVWMHPYLAAVFPFEGKQVTNARVKQYPQAKANVEMAFSSSQNKTSFSKDAAAYPWTSGRDANCTATGPCFDYEYHLNGDIVQSFVAQWAASGDTDYLKNDLFPIMKSVSSLYSDLMVKNGSSWQLLNMTDPDEYLNNLDNGAFTLPLIATVMNQTNGLSQYFGESTNATWAEQAKNVMIPRINNISLEYDSINGSIQVKQADVILKIYPLDLEEDYTLAQQRADLDFYAAHQSPNGPGMTFAIFSIAANAISPSGCSAYTFDEYSWSPYARAPWFSFSEQLVDDPLLNGGTNPAYPFVTGHGGFMQVDLFGYLGLRHSLDWDLHIDPSLPPQIEHLGFPTFYHHGWPIQARSNRTHTTVSRQGNPFGTANMTFANSPIKVMVKQATSASKKVDAYDLAPGATLTLPNRIYASNDTVSGNILQCQPVTSPSLNQPGLFAIAAVDGSTSTMWQPQSSQEEQSLTVNLNEVPFQLLKYASFNWAKVPPKMATIVLHNQTDWSKGQMINITNIEVSQPFNLDEDAKITTYEGNTTVVNFDQPVWSSRYVTLIINGNQGNSSDAAPGATVAEFVLVAQ